MKFKGENRAQNCSKLPPPPHYSPSPMSQDRLFYGWIIVAVAFLTQFIVTGFFFYGFAITLEPMAEEFSDGKRAAVATVHLVMPWVGALMAPFIGQLAGKGHIRALLTAGAVSMASGLLLASQASTLWHLYVIFPTLIAFGANTLSGVVASAIVVNWFDRLRARALGISQIGASVGGVLMAPIGAMLVADYGWRATYLVYGSIAMLLVPLIWLLAVGRPADRGLEPDGNNTSDNDVASSQPTTAPSFNTREILRNPNLWYIALATGIGFSLSSALVTNGAGIIKSVGGLNAETGLMLGLFSLGAALGKPTFGWLADKVGERPAFLVSVAMQLLGLASLTWLPSVELLPAVMALIGLGIGGVLPLSAALVARVFGAASFGPAMGLVMPVLTPLVSVAVPLTAWVYDNSGNYEQAFYVFGVALLLAAALLAMIRLPEKQ